MKKEKIAGHAFVGMLLHAALWTLWLMGVAIFSWHKLLMYFVGTGIFIFVGMMFGCAVSLLTQRLRPWHLGTVVFLAIATLFASGTIAAALWVLSLDIQVGDISIGWIMILASPSYYYAVLRTLREE